MGNYPTMPTKLIINDTQITSIQCENCNKNFDIDDFEFTADWLNFCCSTQIVKNRCILEIKGNVLVKSWKMYNEDWDSDEEEEKEEKEEKEENS
jgi:hypothetical protein